MENYIALLLLIVPGFIAMNIFEKLNYTRDKKYTFETTIYALIFSVFITLFNYIMLLIFKNLTINMSCISSIFSSINFIVLYILITILSSIYIGCLWNLLFPIYLYVVNKLRHMFNKTKFSKTTVFDSYFNDGREHLIKVEKSGNVKVGFLDKFNFEDNSIHEISLIEEEKATSLIKKLKQKAIYFDNGTVITEYDISEAYPKKVQKKLKILNEILINILGLGLVIGLIAFLCFLF